MSVLEVRCETNFVMPKVLLRHQASAPRPVDVTARLGEAGNFSSATSLAFASGAAVVAALLRRSSRKTRAALRASNNMWERKWWSVEETRDPTTLPVWQRDYRFGFQVLKRSMVEARKAGRKVFWDVRVLESFPEGCNIEMLNSGLMGFIPRGEEGLGKDRPKVGEVYKVECVACPQPRVNKEHKWSPWPSEPRLYKAKPVFSHHMYLEQQRSIKKAKDLKAGDIVTGVVHKHCPKGLVITLEGDHKPKGMLAMVDISRKMTAHAWVDKMLPIGTPIKCYVVHADTTNGRITLSTKQFEDDDHVGWMLSFPERCFAMADQAASRYHEKRDAYIQWLQR